MKISILSLLAVLFVGASMAQDFENEAERAEGVDEPLYPADRKGSNKCDKTPKKCSDKNGMCIRRKQSCAGNTDDSDCKGKDQTCCMKHECSSTPRECEKDNGICINRMDSCAGKTQKNLCENEHCTCCKKDECGKTSDKCSSKRGKCINIMDYCDGKTDSKLCDGKNCTCCYSSK
ncbi:low-density lipoprotein receptor-related protein 4-like [Penaeus japonicus]|uniref:low-density lipoprotein receptor-related protein 4-like n=1 Tax=Penaeus japonicus TaxID=27405 RepID=UPI001C70F178|nr:low-density lipoprotein receptor-related protein 4-like [Penaeus japonicus]